MTRGVEKRKEALERGDTKQRTGKEERSRARRGMRKRKEIRVEKKEAIEIHGFEKGTCFRWRLIEDGCLRQRVSLLQDWKTWKRRALLRQMVVVIAAAPQRTPAVFSVYRDGRNHCPASSYRPFSLTSSLSFSSFLRFLLLLLLSDKRVHFV